MTNPVSTFIHKFSVGLCLIAIASMLVLTVTASLSAGGLSIAPGFQVLYSFADSPDGANPFESPVFEDTTGNLYGTTLSGGSQTNGTIFRLNSTGETVLHRFSTDANGRNPSPMSGVIGDDEGHLYGTETFGGPNGDGTVFRLDATGRLTILHAFTGGADGNSPYGGLTRDAAGNLYGTAAGGGYRQGCGNGCGTVFKIDSTGKFTVLYTFLGSGDGGIPQGTLVLDSAGNIYGTTAGGGAGGQGVVFVLSNTGQERPLYSFSATGESDGMEPVAGVVRDSSGNLYGTTFYGGGGNCFDGLNPGCGTVFKLDSSGTYTVLHAFSGASDGGWSTAALVLATDGNLYGTASGAGLYGSGTAFRVSTSGMFTLLHTFTGGSDGARPMGTLIQDSTGTIYGTTAGGGKLGFGTVFKFIP